MNSKPMNLRAPAYAALALALLAVAGCGGLQADPPPAETAAGVQLRVVEVVSGLDRPIALAAAPGEPGRLYVAGQAGIVSVVEDGRILPEPFLDLSDEVRTGPKGQAASELGLLSIAFAPDYGSSGRFAAFYTDRRGDVRIVELRAQGGRVVDGSARTLLHVRKQTERHFGGALAYGPDGRLYASIGDDAGSQVHPQSLAAGDYLGKVLRLDDEGWTVVAYGLRNPWRFSFDRDTGDLWIGDVGEQRVEEIDRIPAASGLANLGWDGFEGYERVVWDQGGHHDPRGPGELMWPVASYSHDAGCAVVGGYLYRGSAVPLAAYFYGDFCAGAVWNVDPADPAHVRHELELRTTIASFGEDENGELYLVSRTGRIFRLSGPAS
jgi:glucose/arabinose dehydrogenase